MTEAHREDMRHWYEGSRQTNQYIPRGEFTDSRDAPESQGDEDNGPIKGPAQTAKTPGGTRCESICGGAPDLGCAPVCESVKGLEGCESDNRLQLWLSDQAAADVPQLEVVSTTDTGSVGVATVDLAVMVELPGSSVSGDSASTICRACLEPLPGSSVSSDSLGVTEMPGDVGSGVPNSSGFEPAVAPDVTGMPGVLPRSDGNNPSSATEHCPVRVEAVRPVSDPMEEGPSMAHITSYTIAMELRSRFGNRVASGPNIELGARVAREILKSAGAVRSDNYYLAQQAVKFFLSPTLLDVVFSTPVQDFC
nr:replication-associated protein [Carrot umbravirus 2]